MFRNKRAEEAESRAQIAEMRLQISEMRLAQYDRLMANLQKHDWFEFNSGGGIIAHDKNEPDGPFMYGTGYCWPDPKFRCTITYN